MGGCAGASTTPARASRACVIASSWGPHDIKLDRSLVARADRDPARLAAIVGFQKFADQVGARLIAEGIETEAERTVLLEVGVRFGQGYLFGEPGPLEALPSQ